MRTLELNRGAPSGPPLELATLKTDLRISDTALDGIIAEQYIPAARDWAEGYTKRALIERPMAWHVDRFPGAKLDFQMLLPGGLVSAVTDIRYISNGTEETLLPVTDFQVAYGESWARLAPLQGGSWPAVDSDAIRPVTVNYTAGWPDPVSLPGDVRRALTAYVYGQLELDGLLTIRNGFDMDHPEKLLSSYRTYIV